MLYQKIFKHTFKVTFIQKIHIILNIFQRISHGFFLSSPFTDLLPFVELNGKKISGSTDKIIRILEKEPFIQSEIDKVAALSKAEKAQERYFRRTFDEVVYK